MTFWSFLPKTTQNATKSEFAGSTLSRAPKSILIGANHVGDLTTWVGTYQNQFSTTGKGRTRKTALYGFLCKYEKHRFFCCFRPFFSFQTFLRPRKGTTRLTNEPVVNIAQWFDDEGPKTFVFDQKPYFSTFFGLR